jgi:phage terminase small subunit
MSRTLGAVSHKPRNPRVPMPPIEKSQHLSPWASAEWDQMLSKLKASHIELTPAHAYLLTVCSTLRADIRDCWAVIQENGGSYTKAGTGAVKLHPAAARLDVLRRDLTKALALLGLQKPEAEEPAERRPTLKEILDEE